MNDGSSSRWRDAVDALGGLLAAAGVFGRPPRRVRLPIAFLPGDVGVLRRRQPGLLLTRDPATRLRCLRALLESELEHAPVTWLGADEDEVLALGPVVERAALRGRMRALASTEGAAAAQRERGDDYLIHELGACVLRRGEMLVIDLLVPWLAAPADGADPTAAVEQAGAALLRWAQMHARGPVLALAPAQHGGHALLPLFERSTLPNLAQLQRHGEQTHLEVTRWSGGRGGTVQALGFGLVERDDGGWQADGSGLALDTHALVTAGDADVVLTLADALAGSAGVPPGWKVFDTLGQLVAACRYLVAATVVLPYRGGTELPLLVDTVRQLRSAHPHALKIVVREAGGQLRYNQELALLRFGTNTVVYRDVGFSHLLQTLDALRNQTFSRRIPDGDASELLQSVAPDPVRGYLPLPSFCEAAQRMLDRTAPLGMEHCIVQLPLLPQVAHLDALAACKIGRDGDLVTADAQAVWLFLFACRAPDVEATLKRLFMHRLSELFSQVRVRPDADAMGRALERLRRHGVDAVTDYGDALLALQPARLEVGERGFVALQPSGADTMPSPLDELAPAPPPTREPERHTLRLRGEPAR